MALQLFKIADVTVTSPQASIEFANIPSGYTDLLLKVSPRITASSHYDYIAMEFNNDTTTANYKFLYLYGNGAVGSGSGDIKFAGYSTAASATTSTFGNGEVYIPNYAGSNSKSYSTDSVAENNSGTNGQYMLAFHAGRWTQTNAITSIKLTPNSGTFVTHSTATLYGVL